VTDNGKARDRRLIALGEAFAFILPLARSNEFTGEILLRIFQEGATPIDDGPPRFTIGSIQGLPMFQVPSPFNGRFWDAHDGERIVFNPVNGAASWHGPRKFRGDAPRELMVMEAIRHNGKLPPVDIQLLGLRVRYDVVLAHLRFRGLWPPTKLQADRVPSASTSTTEQYTWAESWIVNACPEWDRTRVKSILQLIKEKAEQSGSKEYPTSESTIRSALKTLKARLGVAPKKKSRKSRKSRESRTSKL